MWYNKVTLIGGNMKLLIASDIHGSGYYMEKLEQAILRENPDKIVLLGDFLYQGPRNPFSEQYNPMKVVEILKKYRDKIIAVRGNCDSEVDEKVLEFPIMEDYQVLEVDGHKFYFTHGHVLEKVPYQDGILIHGHTHVYHLGKDYINPGSISLPKVYEEHTYLIYQNHVFTLYDDAGNKLEEISL